MRATNINIFLWIYFCVTFLVFVFCFIMTDNLYKKDSQIYYRVCEPTTYSDNYHSTIENLENDRLKSDQNEGNYQSFVILRVKVYRILMKITFKD
jgi:hypothetical protein